MKKLAVLFIFLLFTACSGGDPEEVKVSTSFISSSLVELPTCDATRIGHLAYVTDVGLFYTCDGASWTQIDITGAQGPTGATGATGASGSDGSGVSVYDDNENELGTLVAANWPSVGIQFGTTLPTDAGIGFFGTNGKFTNSFCQNGFCSNRFTGGVSTGMDAYLTLSFPSEAPSVIVPTNSATTATRSYLFFTTYDCSETGYSQVKPIKNALFRVPTASAASGFVRATGSEVLETSLIPQSVYVYDVGSDCISSGNGACCVLNHTVSDPQYYGYAISVTASGYTFPGSLSHPFTGPLKFHQ